MTDKMIPQTIHHQALRIAASIDIVISQQAAFFYKMKRNPLRGSLTVKELLVLWP